MRAILPLLSLLSLLALAGCERAPGPGGAAGKAGGQGLDASDRDADGDGVGAQEDCDDQDPAVGEETLHFLDSDGDGYGQDGVTRALCEAEPGWIPTGGDCDDHEAATHPGAPERCNGTDDDCDGLVDNEDPEVDLAGEELRWPDADGDGWGASEAASQEACEGTGWAATPGDCDDDRAAVHPDATEVCSDGLDNDCDGLGCGALGPLSSDEALLHHLSPDLGDASGEALGLLHDTDRDRLVLGAPQSNAGAAGGGAIWVTTATEGAQEREPALRVSGSVDELGLGATVAGVDDFDGDGVGDLVLGSTQEATAWLLSGVDLPQAGDWRVEDLAQATLRSDSGGRLRALAAGDLDGDGLGEVLLGEPEAESGAGTVWLLYGDTEGWAGELDLANEASASFVGESGLGQVGTGALAAGDLDGDGVSELILGERSDTTEDGAVGIWTGAAGARWSGSWLAADADARVEGAGGTGGVLPDLDGDGYDELLLGGPGEDGVAEDAGAVWIFAGRASWSSGTTSDASGRLLGETSKARLGASVMGLEDLDDDGVSDLAVGAPGLESAGGGFGRRGAVLVFSGSAELLTTDTRESEAHAVISGAEVDSRLGGPALLAADLNGDGRQDLVVGVPGGDAAATFYGGGL